MDKTTPWRGGSKRYVVTDAAQRTRTTPTRRTMSFLLDTVEKVAGAAVATWKLAKGSLVHRRIKVDRNPLATDQWRAFSSLARRAS